MRRMIWLSSAFAGLAALAYLASTGMGGPASNDKFALKHAYQAGDRFALTYKIDEEKKASGKHGGDMSLNSSLLISLEVANGSETGQKLVKIQFKRILAELKAGDLQRTVDSENPKSLLPTMPLDLLTKVTFQATVNASGEIVKFEGAEGFVEKWKPDQAEGKEKQELQEAVAAGIKQLLEEPFVYLPKSDVAVGESWTLKRKVYGLPVMGSRKVHEEEVTCKLSEVRQGKGGRVAVISIEGQTTIIQGAMPGDPKTKKKAGKVEYNVDTNVLLFHHIELAGDGVISMPDGQEIQFSAQTTVETALRREAQ